MNKHNKRSNNNDNNIKLNIIIFITILLMVTMFLSGCKRNEDNNNNADNNMIITGVAEETKEGYYVNEYVLEHEEIQRYNQEYNTGEYNGKKLEILGEEKKVEIPCETETGEITQCREGSYKIIYNVQSIKVLE